MTDAINPNRADQLRQRRVRATQERINQTAQRGAHPIKSQPVTQRRDTAPRASQSYRSIPVVQKARTKTRRQYYYTLSGSGAEVRLPSLPMVQFGPRMFSFILLLVLGIALFSLLETSTFTVGEISVNGPQRVTAEDINLALDMDGETIFAFNQTDAIKTIETAFPELTHIQISVGLPANITITAEERTPILAWQYGETSLWMDDKGVIFPVRGTVEGSLPVIQAEAEPPLVPVIVEENAEPQEISLAALLPDSSASIWGRQMDPQAMEMTFKMLPQLPEGANLVYDRFSGFGWNDTSGWKVYIGRSLEEIDIKMVEYQTIVSYLGTQGVTPSVISVESIHAPFFRTEN